MSKDVPDDKVLVWDKGVPALIKKLTKKCPQESFYLCDLGDVVRKHINWKSLLPRVEPHYAVKCNPTTEVVRALVRLGAGFDCASREEIRQVLKAGASPDKIIFANPTKLPSHITYAATVKVATMTFDCESELHKIKKLFPDAKTILRIRHDDPLAHYNLGKKFGCDAATEAPRLLEIARDLQITVVGVSFHIGSSSTNPGIFAGAIEAAAGVFEVATRLGFELSLLDIGGGFMGELGTSLQQTAEIINAALKRFFPDPSVRVISEPGRYYVASAFILASNIHTVKVSHDEGEQRYHYYIDDGVYTSFIAVLLQEEIPGQAVEPREGVPIHRSTIWGPTCDSTDRVYGDIKLPRMEVGDWLVFYNMGAYTLSVASNFNGFSAPRIYMMCDSKMRSYLKKCLPEFTFIADKVSPKRLIFKL